MEHLKEEDMARMIQGNIRNRERKKYLQHLSQCDSCSKVFSETLKFFQEEEKKEDILKIPGFTQIAGSRFRQIIDVIFKRPLLVPALAAVIIILTIVPFLIIGPGPGILKAKRENVKEFFSEIQGNQSLVELKDVKESAVCIGIIVEDLLLFVEAPSDEDLFREVAEILHLELKNIFKNDIEKLFPGLSNIERKNLQKAAGSIEEQLANRSLSTPFRFGRFLEQTLLGTFEEKRSGAEEIDKYLKIARELEFAPGVVTRLEKLKEVTDLDRIRSLCKEIKRMFFE